MTSRLGLETDAAPGPEIPAAPASTGVEPPVWLRMTAFVPAAAVLAFGSVGLVLAINGWYRPALAFPIGAVVWLALVALAWPAIRSDSGVDSLPREAAKGSDAARATHKNWYAAVGVAAIVLITGWNMAHASTHVLIDRDGGSYANTARWIARDGSLTVDARVGPFAQAPVGFDSSAVFEVPGGKLQFQFAHFLPVLLAEGHAVAGDPGLFHTPELLGGFALLAFFVLAWRLFRRPLFALSAMLALALIIPQVAFSRDSYSEIPSQILLFTALALLVTPRVLPRWRIAFASGLFLGALEATRIDAVVFLVGVPVVCAVAWLRAEPENRRRVVLPAIVAFAVGIVPGMALGLIDLARHSGSYYPTLSGDVHRLTKLTVAVAVVCIVVVALWKFVFPFIRRLPWNVLSWVAAGGIALAGFAVWAFRPHFQIVHGDGRAIVGLQQTEHLAIDPTRLYFERSMSWMAWYLGPLTLALAIIGAGLIVLALLRGHKLRTLGALAILGPGSVIYLYKARAVPDHVWVTRRFLVSSFPTLILLALGLLAYVASRPASARWSRPLRIAAIAAAIVSFVYPAYTLIGIRSMSEESGYLAVVHDLCHDVGPKAAVIILEQTPMQNPENAAPQAIRSWCGSIVGISSGTKPEDLQRLAREWAAEGRSLYVVSSSPDYIRSLLPTAEVMSTRHVVDDKLLAPTLTHRPDAYGSQSLQFAVAKVPVSE